MSKSRNLADLLNANGDVKLGALVNAQSPLIAGVDYLAPDGDGSGLTGIEGVPSGVITMWSGLASAIPSGWNLCDGSNGTPNLIGRFIKAASTAGATGGSYTTSIDGSHTHSHSLSAGGHTLSASEMPSHKHNEGTPFELNPWGIQTHRYGTSGSVGVRNSSSGGTGYFGNTETVGGSSSHSHSLSGGINSDGSHIHTIEPTYFELCYIMKS